MKPIITRVLFLMLAIGLFQTSASAISPLRPASGEPGAAVVKSAMETLEKLSKKEKKTRFKQIRKAINDYKDHQKTSAEPSTNTILLVILAILLPPLAIYLHQGEINKHFWIGLVLTILGWLPGVIYALVLIL